jgi:hypothetical protein
MATPNLRALVNQLVQNQQIDQPQYVFSHNANDGMWECTVNLTQSGKHERATASASTKAEAQEASLAFLTLPKLATKGPKLPLGKWTIDSAEDKIKIKFENPQGNSYTTESTNTSNVYGIMVKLYKTSLEGTSSG